jgi:uncharacterized protein YuzE
MNGGLRMRYDPDVDALYLQLRNGEVANTLEIEQLVYLDVDKEGHAVGIEFVSGGDFLAFLQRHGGTFTVPERVDASMASVTV